MVNVLSNLPPLYRCMMVLLFTNHTSTVCLLSCHYIEKWDCLFTLWLYESWGSISTNIFLKLFHFALKNATISILQTYSILWPAALLYNSLSHGNVCIATAKKKKKKERKGEKSLHIKFRDETAPINVVLWSSANLFVQSFDEWCCHRLFSAVRQHRELTEAVCPVVVSWAHR